MTRSRIYVCDDELLIRLWLVEHLADEGYNVEGFESGEALLEANAQTPADLILLDLKLPDGSGLDFLLRVQKQDQEVPVIMITAFGEVETAVAAVRSGAYHFLEKPLNLSELLLLVEQALRARKILIELERHRDRNRWQFADVALVGRSAAIRQAAELISRIGDRGTPSTVLISGDSGTGKDVVARAIHAHGPRRQMPFVNVNCTALPEHLVESELFGHEAGAFTDAKESKTGLLELADGGTLFLDEIGDMARRGQAKLLQFLETHHVRRVGGIRDINVDVQVVTATNQNLESAVESGDFREDLFYRLNVIPIRLPPLRERPEDIAPLASHFIESLCSEMALPTRSLSVDTLQVLEAYSWPGNARELRNVIERLLLLHDDDVITAAHLPLEIRDGSTGEHEFVLPPRGVALAQLERQLILQALQRCRGNKSMAARLLGISRDQLRYRLDKHGVQDDGS